MTGNNCDTCQQEIKDGEEYVAYVRHVEKSKKAGPLSRLRGHARIIQVKDAADQRIVHVTCDLAALLPIGNSR